MKKTFLLFLSVLFCLASYSQKNQTNSDTLRNDALKVCMRADDYIRREISFINYVKDIKEASVYIITTTQQTGSNGIEYTYFLTGQNEFSGMNDTVVCFVSIDETLDIRRQKQVATLKMALMRYVAKTPLAEFIDINFNKEVAETVTSDKWDSWVFTPYISTSLYNDNGASKSYNIDSRFYVDRVTEDLKINLQLNYRNEVNKHKAVDDWYTSKRISKLAEVLIVKSLSNHWSYGGSVSFTESNYTNLDLQYSVMPGIEYDLFPYSESNRRQLRLLYQIGYKYSDYHETTIFGKNEDSFWLHSISIAYMVIEKWGNINLSLGYSNDLENWANKDLDATGMINFRIAKGLFLNFRGGFTYYFKDSEYPKSNDPEAIIIRNSLPKERYYYNLSFGLYYTFGSIYNNVVNPRFGN